MALWSGMAAFFATLLAVGAINVVNPTDQLRFLSSFVVGLITGGAVYARERMHDAQLAEKKHVDGRIVVTEQEDKKVYSLELEDDPEKLEKKNLVVFRVQKK